MRAIIDGMATPGYFSPLQQERLAFMPTLPRVLASGDFVVKDTTSVRPVAPEDGPKVAALFPGTISAAAVRVQPFRGDGDGGERVAKRALKVGCVLSGGQAPGGHNVIAGLYDGIKRLHPDSVLYGFRDGPRGLFTGSYVQVDDALMNTYRNMGGFDMIGSGRDKIETPEQFAGCKQVAESLGLDGVIIIGGDDSNTNAALLAESFAANGCRTCVIGCPKTIDGDLKVPGMVDISFGFDTACKTYSELIGNVCLDALSSGKYYHFIRLMGRAASNITLECALQTHPNITLLGEEVAARRQNLASITQEVVQVILERAALGKHYGVVLVPEGLIEFVPEINALLKEVNELLAGGLEPSVHSVGAALSTNNAALFAYLPAGIKKQLLAERDPHGNVQVSLIETERLLAELIEHELHRLKTSGKYSGSFTYQCSFFGYEARCGLPSDFDTTYCYALGFNAAVLIAAGRTGLMSSVTNLGAVVEEWACGGVPLTVMMNIERRKGKDKPVIRKALVELTQLPFRTFAAQRRKWALNDCYRCPGPVQLDTRGKQRSEAGTRVEPLCFTLALELKERAEHAGGAPPAVPARGNIAGYSALCEALLSDPAVSSHDVERLHLYRLAHGISDTEHFEVLDKLGITEADWATILSRTRRETLTSRQ